MSLAGLLLSLTIGANDPAVAPTAEQLRFFETSVRPVLAEHCLQCHGPEKQWANLRLDARDALLKGGDTGPAIVAGKPDESRLMRAVRQVDDDLKMPPEGPKLTDRQIADLARWIEMGAPFPATTDTPQQRTRDANHWAFQPPQPVSIPTVQNAAWVQSPIDNFILARLEAQGLQPLGLADKRTFIRRVTFDLLGLPPTPEEIEAFLADDRPDASVRLVDRLLASPAYGERWARHWLDVARYADSNGLDENVCHGNAWRYRDYVVSAFNRDEPFDRFIVAQLAGDLLPWTDEAQRHEQLIATGFLGIGPKVLAEVDEAKMQMDIVDEQIDTVGRAFLGLTLGCARCHDHKFDPISTADYYGLAGIFKSTRTMEHFKKVARWHENVLESPQSRALQAEYDAQIAAKQQAIDILLGTVPPASSDDKPSNPKAGGTGPTGESRLSADDKAALKKLRDELAQLQKTPPELPSAMGTTEATVADVAIHIRGNPLKLGDVVERHVPPVLRGPASRQFSANESGRREFAQWLIDPQHPLTARVLVNRVWRWHFGRGIVSSTDNFGLLSEPPSHPELLDWLALQFIESDWSLKSLHRLIVTSSTYQQASREHKRPVSSPPLPRGGGEAGGVLSSDPENRLLHHFPVRRLEAEEIRDALLAVSGQLDDTFGGSLLKVKNRGYFFDHTSKDLTDYNSLRRSLYLPVVRNNLYDVFQLLDAPDATIPTSDRPTTTVAPQALLMLNSDFVMQCAGKFAERLVNEPVDDATRMRRMYLVAYGRDTTEVEIAENAKFLAELDRALSEKLIDAADRKRVAWGVLCQVVLAGNEFVYVE